MERVNNIVGFVNWNGGGLLRLPPGFRFHPTDEELVVQYLKRKVLSYPLPASIIPELVDVCKIDPWDLPGDRDQERYFFSTSSSLEVNPKLGGRKYRATTGSGYWKAAATTDDREIVSSKNNEIVVGMKKTLVFFFYRSSSSSGNHPPKAGLRTDWIMHQYRLVNKIKKKSHEVVSDEEENWVLCRIYLNLKKKKKPPAAAPSRRVFNYDFIMAMAKAKAKESSCCCWGDDLNLLPSPPAPANNSSSSGSSDVTHDHDQLQDEYTSPLLN